MQRMHLAAIFDGRVRRLERLAEHLSPEDLRAARVAALAAKQVHLESLELELLLQVREALVHQAQVYQEILNVPFISAECPGKVQT